MYFFKKFSVPNLDGGRGRPGQRKPLSAAKERLLVARVQHIFLWNRKASQSSASVSEMHLEKV